MKYVRNDKAFTFNCNTRLMVYQSSQMTTPFNIALQGRISIEVRSHIISRHHTDDGPPRRKKKKNSGSG